MNELQDLYKTYSNRKLLTILHEKNKYTPEAIKTALAEIDSRKLTLLELEKAKADIIQQEENRKQQIQKAKARRTQNRKQIQSFLNPVNTPKKIIAFVTISLGLFSLYPLYITTLYSNYEYGETPFNFYVHLFSLFITPIVLIMFYMRIKISWYLLVICLLKELLNIIDYNVIRPISGIIHFYTKIDQQLVNLPMLIRSYWLENINVFINFFEFQLIICAFALITKKSVRAYYK